MCRVISLIIIALFSMKLIVLPVDSSSCIEDEVHSLDKDKHLIHRFLESLRSHHLVFIGDSLTRFHYIAIVYALKYKRFMDSSLYPNPTNRSQYESNNAYYISSSELFAPNSFCDCHYPATNFVDPIENRYYFDTEYNFNITYLLFYG